jgi:release factor glutamine methyltransferase
MTNDECRMTIAELPARGSLNRNSSFVIRNSARGLLERGTALIGLSDAEFLLAELLARPRHALYESDLAVPAATAARFLELAQQAADGTPVEYLLKTAAFLDFRLFVDERVLIPRPETEELVVRALAKLDVNTAELSADRGIQDSKCKVQSSKWNSPIRSPQSAVRSVLDLGTGSGCIAIALARALPEAHVVATDISPAALEVAELNVKRHGLTDSIELLHSDLFEAMRNPDSGPNPQIPQITQIGLLNESVKPPRPCRCERSEAISMARGRSEKSGVEEKAGDSSFVIRHSSFDLVVSNPPYVPRDILATLSPSVRCHEPRLALDGGIDGMDVVGRLVREAPAFMSPGALLALEIDPAIASAVRRLLPDAAIEHDVQGLERYCFWFRVETTNEHR